MGEFSSLFSAGFFQIFLGAFLWMNFFVWGMVFLNLIGKRLLDFILRGYSLDVYVSLLSWIPWVLGFKYGGGMALSSVILAQLLCLLLFSIIHTLTYRLVLKVPGSNLRKAWTKAVGPIRAVAGLWLTLLSFPFFLVLRFGHLLIYPVFIVCLRFPRYKMGDWIQISRHKFEGLVGMDLLACVYCEWAAGVTAFTSELVRNHESFWCPIRFQEGKHCENCHLDFPDLAKWEAADGKIENAAKIIEKYHQPGKENPKSWYGHPERKSE